MRKLIVFAGWIVVAGCSSSKPAATPEKSGSAVATMSKMANLATDPFAQMSFAFEGNPPADLIRERVDKVLPMYGMEVNDDNRNMVGRTVVALRKQHAHTEMEILDKMLATPADGAKFEEAAGRIAAGLNQ